MNAIGEELGELPLMQIGRISFLADSDYCGASDA